MDQRIFCAIRKTAFPKGTEGVVPGLRCPVDVCGIDRGFVVAALEFLAWSNWFMASFSFC